MLGFAFRDLGVGQRRLSSIFLPLVAMVFCLFQLQEFCLILQQPFLAISSATWLFLVIGVILGVVGYGSLISAMRIGEVSAITPFRYTRLIFGLSIGYFIFDEHVGAHAIIVVY